MDEVRDRSVASPRFLLLLLSAFSAVALILAVIGVYGLVSHSVAQSRRDIGIRMAIGAHGHEVVRMFLREGLALTACGLALGGRWCVRGDAADGGPFVRRRQTPSRFAGTALAMGVAAVLACYVPARRSATVDPLMALRHE